jgi:hypothetical protein
MDEKGKKEFLGSHLISNDSGNFALSWFPFK